MQRRYALRFESGERRGETVPIEASGMTLGRRPANTVTVADASVSGRHAELVVDAEGVLLRDLGSTNGTKVAGERVSERRLAHGDEVLLGNVRFVFVDRELAGEPEPVAPVPASSAEAAGEAVHTISAERLQRQSRRPLALVALALLAAAAAGGWLWWEGRQGAGGSSAAAVPEPPAGELLGEAYSFEGGGWDFAGEAPAAFEFASRARRSGDAGLRAELEESGWALVRSEAVPVSAGRTLRAAGFLRSEGGAEGRVGVVLESSTGAGAPIAVWSAPARAPTRAPTRADDFEEVALETAVPPLYDRARAAVLARSPAGEGAVEVDDLGLLPGSSAAAPAARIGEVQLFLLGEPPGTALLFKIDRALVSDLRIDAAAEGPRPGAPLSAEAEGGAIALRAAGEGAGSRTLTLRVEPSLAGGGLATMGAGGYRTHPVEFEREGATSVLFGSGADLVRLELPGASRVTGRPEGEGFRIEAGLGADAALRLQLTFSEERAEAQSVARRADAAEARGELGPAISLWSELLDRYPFEPALVQRAEQARGRLVDKGLSEVRELRAELERARFFRLAEAFRQLRERTAEVEKRYAQSEVDEAARELGRSIETELAALETDLGRTERARLAAIRATLEQGGMELLAGRVETYMQERFGPEPAREAEERP